jgi:hypothetical protein
MQENNPEYFVVRIFRHEPGSGEAHGNPHLTGIVENPCTGHGQAFHTRDELWEVLTDGGASIVSSKRKPAGKVTNP